MIMIPARYVPQQKPDYIGELEALMLPALRVGDLRVLPPVPAVLSLWDLVDSRWCTDPRHADPEEVAIGLYLQCHRELATEMALAFARGSKEALTRAALEWFDPYAADVFFAFEEIVNYTQIGIDNGFQLLPRQPAPAGEWWFDAPWLGGICAMAAAATGQTIHQVMWRMPVAEVGHLAVYLRRQVDPKGCGRKEDSEVLEQMFREAQEREARGEFHPWQLDDPERHSPTEEQIAARPEILQEYEELLRQKREKDVH